MCWNLRLPFSRSQELKEALAKKAANSPFELFVIVAFFTSLIIVTFVLKDVTCFVCVCCCVAECVRLCGFVCIFVLQLYVHVYVCVVVIHMCVT